MLFTWVKWNCEIWLIYSILVPGSINRKIESVILMTSRVELVSVLGSTAKLFES